MAVPMYAAGTDHPLRRPCQDILDLVESGRLPGVTSAEVVQEIMHRYLAIGRRDGAIALSQLTLDLFAPVIPITHGIMQRVPGFADQYQSLSARDIVHVATCAEERIEAIVSPDSGFDFVAGLTRIAPGDLRSLAGFTH